ncbi:WGR domain protein [Escherichia coli DEC5B]|nr:WGR domain protein [Escherichia coli DEC5B]
MRHFIYQDEKSHKFWAVEQQGNELHINWGKVGTNGQSQIKSFADAAAAAKAELKLIAEKTKKAMWKMLQQTCISPPLPKPLLKLKLPLRVKTNAPGWLMMRSFG